MEDNDMQYAIAKAASDFTDEYRGILNKVQGDGKVSDETYDLLYALGASVKHAFDNLGHELKK